MSKILIVKLMLCISDL